MTGCVFKRKLPSGKISWGYSLDHGKGADGKRKQEVKSGFPRRSQAEDALRKRLNEKDAGDLVRSDATTFAGFLEEWFREHAARQCSPKTVERYRHLADYMIPHRGTVKLQELSAFTAGACIQQSEGCWRSRPVHEEGPPTSGQTVRHIAGVVNVALATALRWKVIRSNPMDAVVLPKVNKKEARALDPAQLTVYLEAARACGLFEFLDARCSYRMSARRIARFNLG